MPDIFSSFLSFCFQFFPFLFLHPSSLLLTDSSGSSEEPEIILEREETLENDSLYPEVTDINQPVLSGLTTDLTRGLKQILLRVSLAPVERTITDLSLL